MKNVFAYIVIAGAAAVAVPGTASAQVYPERVTRVLRHLDYQRDRTQNRAEQVERTTKTIRLGADGELILTNIAGDIAVSRGSGADATVAIVKTARGRDDADAKEQLQLVQVLVTERNNRAEVKTQYPRGDEDRRANRRNINVSVDYTVTAPAGARVTVRSVSGDIKIADIKGEVDAETVSGNVQLSGLGRLTGAKSVSGNVEVTDTQVEGTLDAGSVSGDVVARRVKAQRLDLSSVSGNIVIEDVQCDRIQGHSTSGNTRFTGQLAKGGRYELKSFSGEVRLALAGNVGFELEASSFSGDVRSDLPLTTHGAEGDRRRRRSLNGTYGDGSASLQLTTFSGSIVIGKR